MVDQNERERELAYRYDLFIASDWAERFDQLVVEHFTYPDEGRFLEVNCGTGNRVLSLVLNSGTVEVVGTDDHGGRLALARAKAETAQADRYAFIEMNPRAMTFPSESFDAVVVDCSLSAPDALGDMVSEAVRVARPGAPIAVKTQVRGSLDEFASVYWEALHNTGIDEQIWTALDNLIHERPTYEDAVSMVRSAGVRKPHAHRSRQEWVFASGAEFLDSPLMNDVFLDHWFSVVPAGLQGHVRQEVALAIDNFRADAYFDVSIKALVVTGQK